MLIAAVAVIVGLADASRPPRERPSTHLAVGVLHVYQATVSRLYARAGVECRFSPTCSHYAEACIREFGVAHGGWLAAKRLLRCGPWTPAGTADPPPIPVSS